MIRVDCLAYRRIGPKSDTAAQYDELAGPGQLARLVRSALPWIGERVELRSRL